MNHRAKQLEDLVALVGELEHLRRHLVLASIENRESDTLRMVFANLARSLRRRLMAELGEISEEDWCVVKSLATVKQLVVELYDAENAEILGEIDDLATQALAEILGDFRTCGACEDDKIAEKA